MSLDGLYNLKLDKQFGFMSQATNVYSKISAVYLNKGTAQKSNNIAIEDPEITIYMLKNVSHSICAKLDFHHFVNNDEKKEQINF